MELKTYRAANMADALTQVKRDLGKDAVILHARTLKLGGVMGVGAKTVVEITASSDARVAAPRIRTTPSAPSRTHAETAGASKAPPAPILAASATSIPAVARAYAGAAESSGSISPQARVPLRDVPPKSPRTSLPSGGQTAPGAFVPLVPAALDPSALSPHPVARKSQSANAQESPSFVPPPAASIAQGRRPQAAGAAVIEDRAPFTSRTSHSPLATRVDLNPVDQAARSAIESELASIKQLVGEVLTYTRKSGGGPTTESQAADVPASLRPIVESLRRQGLAPQLIDECLQSVQSADSTGQPETSALVGERARAALREIIPISRLPESLKADATGRPTLIALVGPTGVGKTTTIAKLAADYRLRRGLRVGILAADTYRIAAVEQLRTYAGIIGVPLHIVHAPADVEAALAALRGLDVVLLDTAGRSQRDQDRLSELESTLAAAAPDHTLLVLSATVSEPVLNQAAERFMGLRPTGLVFTKLDEAVQIGPAVNTARKLAIGFCCLTDGQDVPDNIEPAHADRIAGLLLEAGEP